MAAPQPSHPPPNPAAPATGPLPVNPPPPGVMPHPQPQPMMPYPVYVPIGGDPQAAAFGTLELLQNAHIIILKFTSQFDSWESPFYLANPASVAAGVPPGTPINVIYYNPNVPGVFPPGVVPTPSAPPMMPNGVWRLASLFHLASSYFFQGVLWSTTASNVCTSCPNNCHTCPCYISCSSATGNKP